MKVTHAGFICNTPFSESGDEHFSESGMNAIHPTTVLGFLISLYDNPLQALFLIHDTRSLLLLLKGFIVMVVMRAWRVYRSLGLSRKHVAGGTQRLKENRIQSMLV